MEQGPPSFEQNRFHNVWRPVRVLTCIAFQPLWGPSTDGSPISRSSEKLSPGADKQIAACTWAGNIPTTFLERLDDDVDDSRCKHNVSLRSNKNLRLGSTYESKKTTDKNDRALLFVCFL